MHHAVFAIEFPIPEYFNTCAQVRNMGTNWSYDLRVSHTREMQRELKVNIHTHRSG